MGAVESIISLENVEKTYSGRQGDITALDKINLSIMRGEIFGIIGLSGAGKSTLVRCMNLLERPTSGKVWIDGRELTGMPGGQLRRERRKISMIFQQFNLLQQRTALENVAFPLQISGLPKRAAAEQAKGLLQTVGLEARAHAYPAQLSGGQQQRVAIARALATEPKVLLCDEATSALDPTMTRSILHLLRDINRQLGITIVMITHEMAVAEEICQRIAVLDQSRVAELGTVREVFAHPKSDIAKRLLFPGGNAPRPSAGNRCYRIVFDGSSSYEPVVADMILRCKTPINILFADMQNLDGQAVGQMIVQVPDGADTRRNMLDFLRQRGLQVEEVPADDWI